MSRDVVDSSPAVPAQDYANSPVRDGDTVHGLQIALVIAGIGATLPMLSLGTQIASAQGLTTTVAIAFMACGLVSLLAALTSVVGARCRLSTYQILVFSFGTRGAQLVNIVLAVMLLGWFAVTADMLGGTVQKAVATLYGHAWPKWEFTCAALMLMTTTGIFGFHVMERFVRVTVPLLTALMVYVLALSISRSGLAPALHRAGDHSLSSVDALSSVIGAIVLTAVLAPDLTRYARNDRQALLSVLGVAIGFPAALILAAIPAAVYGKHDLMDVMALLQIPAIALVLLVVSTWTSNTSNLYSATLTLATLFKRTSTRVLGVWGALLALAAASAGIADYFIPMLIGLGVVSAPLAGVYVVDFWGRQTSSGAPADSPAFCPRALATWALGCAVGLAETYSGGHALTRIPAIDSILITAIAQALMNRSRRHAE
jgi:cytosine permease